MAAFATLDELKARLDWTLDADEERIATSALEDASDQACYHGKEWSVDTAPRMVKTLVLKSAARYMKNPEGYTVSRAGDETAQWDDVSGAGEVIFTPEEIKVLRALAGKGTIGSIPVTAWGPQKKTAEGYVPIEGGGYFPFFSSDTSPW